MTVQARHSVGMEVQCARVVDLLFSKDLSQQEAGSRIICSTMKNHPDSPGQLQVRGVSACMVRLAAPRGGLRERLVALALCHPGPDVRSHTLEALLQLCTRGSQELAGLLSVRGLRQLLEQLLLDLTVRGLAAVQGQCACNGLRLVVNLCTIPHETQEHGWLHQQAFADASLVALRVSTCRLIPHEWTRQLSLMGMTYLTSWLRRVGSPDACSIWPTVIAATRLLLQHQLHMGEPEVRVALTTLLATIANITTSLCELMLQHDLSPLLEVMSNSDNVAAARWASLTFHPSLLPFTTGTLAPAMVANLGSKTPQTALAQLVVIAHFVRASDSIPASQAAQAYAEALVSARVFAALATYSQGSVPSRQEALLCLCMLFTLGPWMAQAAAADASVRRLLRGATSRSASLAGGSRGGALTRTLMGRARTGGLDVVDVFDAWASLDLAELSLRESRAAAGGGRAAVVERLRAAYAAAYIPAMYRVQGGLASRFAPRMSLGAAATGAAAVLASGQGSSSGGVACAGGAAAASEAASASTMPGTPAAPGVAAASEAAAAGSMAGTPEAPAVAAAGGAADAAARGAATAASGSVAGTPAAAAGQAAAAAAGSLAGTPVAAAGEAAAAAAGSVAGTPAATQARTTVGRRQRRCAACWVVAEAGMKLRLCSRCQSVRYCSRECQLKHWAAGHEDECRAAAQR